MKVVVGRAKQRHERRKMSPAQHTLPPGQVRPYPKTYPMDDCVVCCCRRCLGVPSHRYWAHGQSHAAQCSSSQQYLSSMRPCTMHLQGDLRNSTAFNHASEAPGLHTLKNNGGRSSVHGRRPRRAATIGLSELINHGKGRYYTTDGEGNWRGVARLPAPE